jgi:hypothetical protein
MKNFSGMVIFAVILGVISREPKFLYPMKLIFLSAAIAACVLSGCSSQGVQSQSPSITSTPAPTPSPASSIDIERQKAREIVKRLDQMELKFKEDQEKLDQERRENKLCRTKQALADFSPNDKEELSAECKKRLADLDKGASKLRSP